MKPIRIDGSMGEGGGQVLRTSLSLSIITGRSLHIRNIRAGRGKPGLLRQHLTCVRAARAICDGRAEGAELGASELRFEPGAVAGGEHRFDVGSAGSAMLVLQTVLWPLLHAGVDAEVTVTGGTHNDKAPPFDFVRDAFVPIVRRMGWDLDVELIKHGFVPAGGGVATLRVRSPAEIRPLELLERGELKTRRALALYANLKGTIAEREIATVTRELGWSGLHVRPHSVQSRGPGNVLLLTAIHEHVTEVTAGFGARRKSAEGVANDAIREMQTYLDHDAPVGPHLADQLIIPIALAGGAFRATEMTLHTETNIDVCNRFLKRQVQAMETTNGVMVSAAEA